MSLETYEDCSREYLVRRILFLEHQLKVAKMGMRDKFAQAALNGMLSNSSAPYEESRPSCFAQDAYAVADAMLEVRDERNIP